MGGRGTLSTTAPTLATDVALVRELGNEVNGSAAASASNDPERSKKGSSKVATNSTSRALGKLTPESSKDVHNDITFRQNSNEAAGIDVDEFPDLGSPLVRNNVEQSGVDNDAFG